MFLVTAVSECKNKLQVRISGMYKRVKRTQFNSTLNLGPETVNEFIWKHCMGMRPWVDETLWLLVIAILLWFIYENNPLH